MILYGYIFGIRIAKNFNGNIFEHLVS